MKTDLERLRLEARGKVVMLRCALPVNALSRFIQRVASRKPNKDQINTEEALREATVSVQRREQPGTWKTRFKKKLTTRIKAVKSSRH